MRILGAQWRPELSWWGSLIRRFQRVVRYSAVSIFWYITWCLVALFYDEIIVALRDWGGGGGGGCSMAAAKVVRRQHITWAPVSVAALRSQGHPWLLCEIPETERLKTRTTAYSHSILQQQKSTMGETADQSDMPGLEDITILLLLYNIGKG